MIIVKLQGGLGNQMFQLAAGYALAKYYNTNLKLDLSFLKKNNISTEKFTARDYELDVFNHNFEFANENDLDFFFPKNKKIIKRINRKIKRVLLKPVIFKDTWKTNNFFTETSKNTYLDGYWQSEKYFINYRKNILELFKFPELNNKYQNIKTEILNTNSVSIHFRRGDYAHNEHIKSVHGVCDLNYYQNAIKFFATKLTKVKFFLFSDEPDWIKANFKSEYNFEIVKTETAISDMHLMSICKHNIIANSSFSWWGAWLNQNSDKIVIAPRKWFNTNIYDSSEVIPENWSKLK